MINNNELLQDLKNVKNIVGSVPSKNIYKKYGKYNDTTFHRRFGSWNKALIECFGEIVKEKPQLRPIVKCLYCNKDTKNTKFCSSNCSASHNNKKRKKYIDKKCIKCNKIIKHNSICCNECSPLYKMERYGEKTVKEFRRISASKNRYQGVRNHAHIVADYYNLKKECAFCDYKNHFQLCHIKDIGDFPDDATLNMINDPKNLIYLCPNHHWDLDHNLLTL